MITVVCFRTVGAAYCLPVENTLAVRTAAGLVALPAAAPDVAGIIAGDPPISVVSPLGAGGGQILVVEAGGKPFGLLVDVVTGLRRIDETTIRAAPDGQGRNLVSGTIDVDGQLVLLADPAAIGASL